MDDQLAIGTEVEMEHQATYDWFLKEIESGRKPSMEQMARHIAMDHLEESDQYYTFLDAMEDLLVETSE